MSEFLSKSGLQHLIGKVADGSLIAGEAKHASTADVASKVAAANIEGVLSLSQLPKGAVEELHVVATDEARFALTASNVQIGDTVKVTATGKMYFVIDETKLNSEAGYEVYTAGASTFATEAGKVSNSITIKLNGANATSFDGSASKEIDVTPASIGAATSAQGSLANTAVQAIKINGVEQTKSNGEINLPAYPTTLPASDVTDTYSATGKVPVSGTAVASAIKNKQDKATTIAGYGITDAKIANGTITLGNNTITPLTDGSVYASSEQGVKADSAIQGVKINGVAQSKDGDNIVNLPAYPTTLPASDVKEWAKADVKPTYNAKEVALSEYTKAASISAVGASDTVQVAISKLEKALDSKQNNLTIDSSVTSTGTNPVTGKAIYDELAKKVDVISGKGLSTNDYTTDEKTKLSGIAEGATCDSAISNEDIDDLIADAMGE